MSRLSVLVKELRTRMRGRRAAVILTVYLSALAGVGYLLLVILRSNVPEGGPGRGPEIGVPLFITLSTLQLFLIIFIVPGLTGGAIAGERDRRTLDLLLSTPVPSWGIVLGKFFSSLSYALLLLGASLPVFSLAFLFGGVSPRQVALSFLISTATALTLGAVGIFISTLIRRGQIATVLTYAVAFFMVLGTGIISLFLMLGSVPRGTLSAPPLLALNPVASLLSAVFPTPTPVPGFFLKVAGLGLPLWQANLFADAFILAVCLYLATALLRPEGRIVPGRRPI